jgi:hypothetical protein
MKVSTTITAVFVIVALSLTTLGAYSFINTSTEVIESHVQNKLLSTAQSRAEHVETFFDELMSSVSIAATPSDLSIDELVEIRDLSESIHSLYVLDSSGKVIKSSGETPCGNDLSQNEVFIKGMQGTSIINQYYCKTLGKEIMAVATPHAGGVLVARVEMSKLEEIIKDRSGLGETGEVLIALTDDETGERIYLFERLFEEEALELESESQGSAEPMKTALRKEEKIFESSLDYRDEPVIAVSQYIEIADIGLVAKIDQQETILNVRQELIDDVLLISVLIFVIAGLVGWALGRQITKPLKKLTDDVDAITKGKLDIQLQKSTVQEVQSLTDSLNRVLASLKLAILRTGASAGELGIGDLKKKVEEVENKWAVLNKNTDDYIMLIDDKGKINDYNKVPVDTPREKIIGDTIYRYLTPESKTKLKNAFENVNKTGKSESIEMQIILPQGSRWLSTKIIPLQNNTPEEETK